MGKQKETGKKKRSFEQSSDNECCKRDMVGAMTLVFVGFVLLFNFLGILPTSVWLTLLRLSPVLIIVAGLKLMIGNSKISELLISALVGTFYFILGLLLLGGYQVNISGGPFDIVYESLKMAFGEVYNAFFGQR